MRPTLVAVALLLACGDGPPVVSRDAEAGDAGPRADGAAPSDAATRGDGGEAPDAGPPGVDAGPARAFAHDLDADGTPDTALAVEPCGAELCVVVDSTVVTTTTIALPAGSVTRAAGSATMYGQDVMVIGDHVGGPIHEVAVAHQLARGGHDSPALTVLDVEAGTAIGTGSAPADLATFELYGLAGFVGAAAGPDGRLHPFLAPSFGDGPRATWGHLCVARPGAPAVDRCGGGFAEIPTVPIAGEWFREVGAYVEDVDADGWQDLSLIFHQRIQTVSLRTGATLVTTEFDVAASTEPGSPTWFHSGRNYGSHSAFVGADGRLRNVIVGGSPVGDFANANCNVSRFLAVLEATAGAPGSRRLRWSDYFGFASSIFVRYDPAFASDPSADLARRGDFVDGCIHRFSDSRSVIDGEDVVLVNYFAADAPVDECLWEQYQLYLPPAWTEEKADAWYRCFGRNVGSVGVWGMQARRVSDGSSVTGSQRTYVWGRTDRLRPDGEVVYVVESLPDRTRFDLMGVTPGPMSVLALVDGLFVSRGTLPVAGRPAIAHVPAKGAVATGDSSGIAELVLRDPDGDGVHDLQLADGTWVGLSGDAFVVRQ